MTFATQASRGLIPNTFAQIPGGFAWHLVLQFSFFLGLSLLQSLPTNGILRLLPASEQANPNFVLQIYRFRAIPRGLDGLFCNIHIRSSLPSDLNRERRAMATSEHMCDYYTMLCFGIGMRHGGFCCYPPPTRGRTSPRATLRHS